MPRDLFVVVTFCEGDFEDVRTFDDFTAASNYSRGYVSGAGKYGAGSVRAFVLPNEEADLLEYEKCGADILPALEAWKSARCDAVETVPLEQVIGEIARDEAERLSLVRGTGTKEKTR